MKYVATIFFMINLFHYTWAQPFEQTLDNAIMEDFGEMQNRFFALGDGVEYVYRFEWLLGDINTYLSRGPYSFDIRESIDRTIDPGIEKYDPEGSYLVMQLFSELDIENGFYQFTIASVIVQILIFENVFLGKNPELHAHLNSINDYIAEDEFESRLDNLTELLRSFNNLDIKLVRQHMNTILMNLTF